MCVALAVAAAAAEDDKVADEVVVAEEVQGDTFGAPLPDAGVGSVAAFEAVLEAEDEEVEEEV